MFGEGEKIKLHVMLFCAFFLIFENALNIESLPHGEYRVPAQPGISA